jgi:prepilin-type N-terminal cleavage/methylation domain-containing protein
MVLLLNQELTPHKNKNNMDIKLKKNSRAFTIIELIIVIAIIAVLAATVEVSAAGYAQKAKIARANIDVQNISNALTLFYAQYGNYPYNHRNPGVICPAAGCSTEFYSSTEDYYGGGDPYLTVNGTDHYLSELYKSDWVNYNASFFVKKGFYDVALFDSDGDGKIGCGSIILHDHEFANTYGVKFIICQDCPCGTSIYDPVHYITTSYTDIPFQTTPVTW